MQRGFTSWGLAAVIAAAPPALGGGPVFGLQAVVISGQPLPGSTSTFVMNTGVGLSPSTPTVTADGRIAVRAIGAGLWYRDPGQGALTLYALDGAPLVGGPPGSSWTAPERPLFDGLGRVAGGYGQGGVNGGSLITVGSPGQFVAVAAADTPPPGYPATHFYSQGFGRPALNPSGLLAFAGTLSPGPRGIWMNQPGQATTLVLGPDMQAPGFAPGIRFNSVVSDGGGGSILSGPTVNRSGQLAISGSLVREGSVTEDNDAVVWRGTAGGLAPVVRDGDTLPGGFRFSFATIAPVINDAGAIAMHARSHLPSEHGVVRVGNAAPVVLARTNQTGPGMLPNEVWRNSTAGAEFGAPVINGAGNVLFRGTIFSNGNGDQSGLWLGDESGLQMIARTGTGVSGAGAPATLFGVDGSAYTMNARGDVVFAGWLNNAATTYGLFHWSQSMGVTLITAIGDEVEAAPGVTRTIERLYWSYGSGGQDGRAMSLSDNGLFTLGVAFSNGQGGIFVTTVPAPGTMLLWASVGGGLLAARRRR